MAYKKMILLIIQFGICKFKQLLKLLQPSPAMQPTASLEIAYQQIEDIMAAMWRTIRQKEISIIAQKQVTKQATFIHKSFLEFMKQSNVHQKISAVQEPKRLPKDSLSIMSTNFEHRDRIPNSMHSSMRVQKNRKLSIPKCRSRNTSITKASIVNRDMKQPFVQLSQQNGEVRCQLEQKLRRYYLSDLESQKKQESRINNLEKQQQIEKAKKLKNKLQKCQRKITYDFDGKPMQFSVNNKLQNIITRIKTRIGNKNTLKKIQKRKVQSQTIRMQQYESTQVKHRKLSAVIKEASKNTPRQLSMYTQVSSPMLQPFCSNKATNLNLKLSQFKSNSCKYKSLDPITYQSRFKCNTSDRALCSIPNKVAEKRVRKHIRFATQSHFSNISDIYNCDGRTENPGDVIYYNPELYQSMIY